MSKTATILAFRANKLSGFGFDPSKRGYHAVYRLHETNRCPGCDRTQWYVGRVTAECAFCGCALPIEGAKR